jgi:hypothetical protein
MRWDEMRCNTMRSCWPLASRARELWLQRAGRITERAGMMKNIMLNVRHVRPIAADGAPAWMPAPCAVIDLNIFDFG